MTLGKFSRARVSTARDNSPFKSVITGGPGVGKTFFVSTIVSEDGRPVFLLSVEEGAKGVSADHHPGHFEGRKAGSWEIPSTWEELGEALQVFRDEKNAVRPPADWCDSGTPQGRLLRQIADSYPMPLSLADLGGDDGDDTGQTLALVRGLLASGTIREVVLPPRRGSAQGGKMAGFVAKPDATWRRAHIHLAVDSLSGVERLIHTFLCSKAQIEAMGDKEYNQMWTKALPLWETFLGWLDSIRATGVHVWLVAHASESIDASHQTGAIFRKQDLQMRGTNKVLEEARSTIRNWADNVLYIVKDVNVIEGGKSHRSRAQFRGRRLITSDTGRCCAKTRAQVPTELPATWEDWRRAVKAGTTATPAKLRAQIDALLPSIADADREAFGQELQAADSPTKLAAALSRLQGMVACAEDDRAEMAALLADGEADEAAPASGQVPSAHATENEPQRRVASL